MITVPCDTPLLAAEYFINYYLLISEYHQAISGVEVYS